MESQLAVAFAHIANSLNLPWVWVAVGGLLLIALVGQWIIGALFRRLHRFAEESEQQWDDALVLALVSPAKLAWWLLLLTLLFALLPSLASIRTVALTALNASLVLLVPWFLHRLIANVEEQVIVAKFSDGASVDKATVRSTARLLRVALWLVTALMLLQTLGVSVSGLLAFGGIGGIAVGFAAKDLLANFFGGLGIYMDRPFTIGDWVRSPDRSLEGTVEEIGWRVTQIRTFDKRPIYVPNAVFSQIIIENPSRMQNRRIYEKFGLRYGDSRSLGPVIDAIRDMVNNHPDIDTGQTIIVNFESFGGSSLDCFLYCFTRTTNWVEYHGVKQDVLMKVLEIVHEHGADIAFPTRTLHMQNPGETISP
ncbi:mechanosensitive ion channel family protein [Congregibacter litoralis]|uniref:Small-conductance mechanosensitive channel n=1 Tax=Congregibacter litoralis KT71 TaxID=314285 RepID=A4A886_9GAMM|nr:mechanosensitive ion channel family protein [Congregibacter litoralis]EAQ97881.1 Small-conductance mechanosensitive channel [Congregibacter litoralis KT71]